MAYVSIHTHTEYSLLDGIIKVKDIFKRAKELGMKAVAITEHGNMSGTIKKYKLAKAEGIKLLIGMELYVVDDMLVKEKGDKRYHLVVIAKNIQGYKNLIKLASAAACDGFYHRPRVDKKLLTKYSDGLVCTSACMQNDIAQSVLREDLGNARKLIKGYMDMFGKDNFFLEVAGHNIPGEREIAENYFALAKEFDLKVVFGGDAHYLLKSHGRAHECVLALQNKDLLSNPNRFRFSGTNHHFLSEEEARALYPDHPEIFDNTQLLADMCNVELELGKPIFPDFPVPEGETQSSYLKKMCYSGFEKKYGHWTEVEKLKAKERLEYEFGVIEKMGFVEYFLITWDLLSKVGKIEGIDGCGRGSSAGSVVSYCLEIHQAEPIKNDLLFERFLNPDRISLPDIDSDFADRDVAINYVKQKYGADKVAAIGTFGTLACKLAVKDVARAFGVPYNEVNEITQLFHDDVLDHWIGVPAVAAFFAKYPGVEQEARVIQDVIKFTSTHASGICWGKEVITEYVPIKLDVDGSVVTQYDMNEIEAIGLVKMDFLGLDTMNIVRNVLKMIGKDDKWLKAIPFDDKEVYEMLSSGDACGVFQMESVGFIDMLKKIKPTCFDDIVSCVALYRPGSMDYIDVYARRKNGEEEIVYDHPKLEPILKSSMGVICFQEQSMIMSRVLAGFTPGQADTLRKSIGKKLIDLMKSLEVKFKEGCIINSGMTQQGVDELWNKILKSSDYSFNRSHAYVYGISSFRTAYLKKHYPLQFMTAMINSTISNVEKQVFYINEAKRMGIRILPPDINISESDFSTDGKVIRFGLGGIKNVAGISLEIIMKTRPYVSFVDFVRKVDVSKVNKRVQKHLIESGCFDSFGVNRHMLLAGYMDIEPMGNKKEKQMTLFGEDASIKHEFPKRKEPSKLEVIKMEKEAMGISASGDMLDLFGPYDIYAKPEDMNRPFKLFGIVKVIKKVFTKKDQREMCFMTLENSAGKYEIVVFPDNYSVYEGAFYEDAALLIDGMKSRTSSSIILNRVEIIQPV
jgi:DNA polymerase-3 subunit alpha